MAAIREFPTGATRDQSADKYDYAGFLCPMVLERYGAYMHKHRLLPDGTMRPADNWKKGIPLGAYAESEWRHHLDFQKAHQGIAAPNIEDSICALIFNLQGYLHEYLKAKPPGGVVDHALAAAYLRDVAERDDDTDLQNVHAIQYGAGGEVIDVTKGPYVPNPPSDWDPS